MEATLIIHMEAILAMGMHAMQQARMAELDTRVETAPAVMGVAEIRAEAVTAVVVAEVEAVAVGVRAAVDEDSW